MKQNRLNKISKFTKLSSATIAIGFLLTITSQSRAAGSDWGTFCSLLKSGGIADIEKALRADSYLIVASCGMNYTRPGNVWDTPSGFPHRLLSAKRVQTGIDQFASQKDVTGNLTHSESDIKYIVSLMFSLGAEAHENSTYNERWFRNSRRSSNSSVFKQISNLSYAAHYLSTKEFEELLDKLNNINLSTPIRKIIRISDNYRHTIDAEIYYLLDDANCENAAALLSRGADPVTSSFEHNKEKYLAKMLARGCRL